LVRRLKLRNGTGIKVELSKAIEKEDPEVEDQEI
jgi:hypothetical protein